MLSEVVFLGAGVLLGAYISNKSKKKDTTMKESVEDLMADTKKCLLQAYDEIKDISIDDVKKAMMSKYRKLKKKIDEMDFSEMKDKGLEMMKKMKQAVQDLYDEAMSMKDN